MQHLITITIIVIFLFTHVSAVAAETLRNQVQELRNEAQELRQDVRQELRENGASISAAFRLLRSGRIAIGSGELTSINGSTLTVIKDGKSYTVTTDDKTQFHRKYWGKSEVAEFNVGDKLNI
ncbi:MAG: hypothetical protein AAB874_01055, partial [Patescibacteria group bacterium]